MQEQQASGQDAPEEESSAQKNAGSLKKSVSNIVTRLGKANVIWGAVFFALMLVAALIWLCPYSSLTTSTWRQTNDGLPWEMDGVTVKHVNGHWQSAGDNERMRLRAAYYPVAEIELGSGDGSGVLYARFHNSHGHPVGDSLPLPYKNGAFVPRDEINIKASGSKATVFIEQGYETAVDFRQHVLDEKTPLWSVHFRCRPEGEPEPVRLGEADIPAEES